MKDKGYWAIHNNWRGQLLYVTNEKIYLIDSGQFQSFNADNKTGFKSLYESDVRNKYPTQYKLLFANLRRRKIIMRTNLLC